MAAKGKRGTVPTPLDPHAAALDRLRRAMGTSDTTGLLATISGLTTLAENAGWHLRLRYLAELAASLPEVSGRPAPTRSQLGVLVGGPDIDYLMSSAEDPPEQPLTEPVVFRERAYTAFLGQGEEVGLLGEVLFRAIDRLDVAGSTPWASEAAGLIASTFALSDAIAGRLGVKAGTATPITPRISVPSDTAELASAVTWEPADIDGRGWDLSRLTTKIGSGSKDPSFDGDVLVMRPIVATSDGRFVVFPDLMLPALSHAVLTMAAEAGDLLGIASAFAESVHATIDETIAVDLDARMIELDVAPGPVATMRESAFLVDGDTVMFGISITDPLDTFDPSSLRGSWEPGNATQNEIEDRLDELVAWAKAKSPAKPLLIVTPASFPGRQYMFGIGRDRDAYFLGLTLGSVYVIAHIEHRDELALLRYAKSWTALHERAHVFAFNPLDEYALFESHENSFVDPEGPLYNAYSMSPGMGLDLRQRVNDQLDRQSALLPDGVTSHVVVKRYREQAPIYWPWPPQSQPSRLVRLDGLDVSVFGPPASQITRGLRVTYSDILDAAAFWVWQAGPQAIVNARSQSGSDVSSVAIFIQLDEPDEWEHSTGPLAEPSPDMISSATEPAEHHGMIWLAPSFQKGLMRPDNAGERVLAGILVEILMTLLDGTDPSGTIVSEILGEVAPFGQRKMLIVLSDDPAEQIGSDADLPGWQAISTWASGEVLDDLAAGLKRAGRRPAAPGAKTEQVGLLNDAVSALYETFVAQVAELSPDRLMQRLLAVHESLVRELALRRVQTPTRIACFGPYSDIASMLTKENKELTVTSIAHRFLIEYVAATPPIGSAPLSPSRLDRLLAIGASIVDFGFQSDVTQYDLAITDAHILPSGRVGTRSDEFGAAIRSYTDKNLPGQIKHAQDNFASYWEERAVSSTPVPSDWEAAFRAEFRYPISELGGVLGELVNLATEAGESVVVRPRNEVVSELGGRMGIKESAVAKILDDLSLVPRGDFLKPPGVAPQEVWPWRFNRKLSLVRRPIVLLPDPDGPLLAWGWRGAIAAGKYLTNLVVTGRLATTSREMATFKAQVTAKASDEFVDAVADIAAAEGLAVHKKVDKFGPVHLAEGGNTLGDVDVLAIDVRRKTLWALECKNLDFAKTPWELWSEVREFEDPKGGIFFKHGRRVTWMRAHMIDVLNGLGLTGSGWRVEPVVVLRSDVIAVHLRSMAMQTIDASDLGSTLRGRPPVPPASPSGTATRAAPAGSRPAINLAIRPRKKRR